MKDTEGNVSVSVAATPNMASAKETLAAYGKKAEWDEETGQYYGEYEKGGATYRVWLEDEDEFGQPYTYVEPSHYMMRTQILDGSQVTPSTVEVS